MMHSAFTPFSADASLTACIRARGDIFHSGTFNPVSDGSKTDLRYYTPNLVNKLVGVAWTFLTAVGEGYF